jgi:hypothetical protein
MMMQENQRFINGYIKPLYYIMEQVDDDAGNPKIYKWIYQAKKWQPLHYGTSG